MLKKGLVASTKLIDEDAFRRLEKRAREEYGYGTRWFIIEAETLDTAIQVTEKVVRQIWN